MRYNELPGLLIIQITLNRPLEKDLLFDILVSPEFPLSPPKIRTLSSVLLILITPSLVPIPWLMEGIS